jgi:hypothetical protein
MGYLECAARERQTPAAGREVVKALQKRSCEERKREPAADQAVTFYSR